ncbi:hypothetical protein IF1G_06864 [Cordyceps javanica]|uniref:Uncharacterized protein n=1 Tax=Cordyceps javanica TaxID=43265 RepID=A0A545UZH5_9HYPO|nr:hypothetical protein IF1G_06864 [Cordyceps javanica]
MALKKEEQKSQTPVRNKHSQIRVAVGSNPPQTGDLFARLPQIAQATSHIIKDSSWWIRVDTQKPTNEIVLVPNPLPPRIRPPKAERLHRLVERISLLTQCCTFVII